MSKMFFVVSALVEQVISEGLKIASQCENGSRMVYPSGAPNLPNRISINVGSICDTDSGTEFVTVHVYNNDRALPRMLLTSLDDVREFIEILRREIRLANEATERLQVEIDLVKQALLAEIAAGAFQAGFALASSDPELGVFALSDKDPRQLNLFILVSHANDGGRLAFYTCTPGGERLEASQLYTSDQSRTGVFNAFVAHHDDWLDANPVDADE